MMRAELRVLSGTRSGLVLPLTQSALLIGRQIECALRFDPDADLGVSGRHAVIEWHDGGWWLRDLGSKNGTIVNGQRIVAPVRLNEGDRISFGAGGPQAELRTRPAARESTTSRIRAQVARQVRHIRFALLALVLLLAVSAAIFVRSRGQRESQLLSERAQLQQQIDSLLRSSQDAMQALQGRVRGLDEALRTSQGRVRDVSRELENARQTNGTIDVDSLIRQLQDARESLRRQQLAASLDFTTIENRNRFAVARIFVEPESGGPRSATAFAVRADGLMLTSKHVVSDSSGRSRPRRMRVQFSDSDQFWNATVVDVADEDLAIVRVHGILGDVPTIQGLNLRSDTVAPGSPVAIIGFPLGGVTTAEARAEAAQPLLSAAIVKANHAAALEIDGYGAAGASGSPIFDRNGEVLAILFGGRRDPKSGQTVVLGVPVTAARRLLDRVR